MRTASISALAAIAALSTTVVAAPQALAYDRDAYEYAAGHMIDAKDIPKALGEFAPDLTFNGNTGFRTNLCYVPSEKPDDDGKRIDIGRSSLEFTGFYNSKKASGPNLQVQVLTYKNADTAIKAFERLKSRAKGCNGAGSTTWTDDTGVTTTYSWNVSTSSVPGVAVAGVPSIGITQDNLSESTGSANNDLDDNYTVYSLVDDAIISTAIFANDSKNLTTAQRKAVNQTAFNAITEWLD